MTDSVGNVVSSSSSGSCGFKGSKKGTPFASQFCTELAVRRVLEFGVKQVDIKVSGPGSGREMAVRTVLALGLSILSITDVTSLAHNGCRPSKKRRV